MRLVDLQPALIRYEMVNGSQHFIKVDHISEAQGVRFLCPKCFRDNGGPRGTHSVICLTRSVPTDASPGPGRWRMEGNGLDDLTLAAYPDSSPSVQLIGGCAWHGFVENGVIRFA